MPDTKYMDEIAEREAEANMALHAMKIANEKSRQALDYQTECYKAWQKACKAASEARHKRIAYLRGKITESLENPE